MPMLSHEGVHHFYQRIVVENIVCVYTEKHMNIKQTVSYFLVLTYYPNMLLSQKLR